MTTPARALLYDTLYLTAGPLTLRPVPWSDLAAYAGLVTAGLFGPDEPSTIGAWYDPADLVSSSRRLVGNHLRNWATLAPEHWGLDFGVYLDNQLIGRQVIFADDFAVAGVVETASFLARPFRGRGYGCQARSAVLDLAFVHLGARLAVTGALQTNQASAAVSRALGYLPDGYGWHVDRSVDPPRLFELHRFLLRAEQWPTQHHPWAISAVGTETLRAVLGLPLLPSYPPHSGTK
jgi:RimJ/RimL family protein N-acetyltransferase